MPKAWITWPPPMYSPTCPAAGEVGEEKYTAAPVGMPELLEETRHMAQAAFAVPADHLGMPAP